VGGSCWYLAEPNESCTETCSTHGGYDEATKTYAGSAGTVASCKAVLNALGGYNYWKGDICGLGGIGCHKYTGDGWRDLTTTTADATPNDGSKRACACLGAGVEEPQPIDILFVANGYYQQEDDIENRLMAGGYNIVKKKDYQITWSTDLSEYELIIITGFAPFISSSGMQNIYNSAKPVFIIESYDYWYSYMLGLLDWDAFDYYAVEEADILDDGHPITSLFDEEEPIQVYYPWSWALAVEMGSVSPDVETLASIDGGYGCGGHHDAATLLVDDDRKIVSNGVSDTAYYKNESWLLFDRIIDYLIAPEIIQPPRNKILLVSNGATAEELALESYLDDFSAYDLDILEDDEVDETTDLTSYDTIVLTEFAPNISDQGLQNIQDSEKPILIVENSSWSYAYRLGLVTSPNAEAETSTEVSSTLRGVNDLNWILGNEPQVYETASDVYTVPGDAVDDDATPLMSVSPERATVLYDVSRGVVATGVSDIPNYTHHGRLLLDMLLRKLHKAGIVWTDNREIPRIMRYSGLNSYLDFLKNNRTPPSEEKVRKVLWNLIVKWNLFDAIPYIRLELETMFYVLDHGGLSTFTVDRPVLPHHERCGYPYQYWLAGQSWWDPGGRSCSELYYPDCPYCQTLFGGEPTSGDLDYEGIEWWSDTVTQFHDDFDAFTDYIDDNINNSIHPKHYINSYIVRGVDMGANVRYGNRTFFYFGDTWGWLARFWSGDEFRNDAIAVSTDQSPDLGIDITFAIGERLRSSNEPVFGSYGVNITGVHEELETHWMEDYWAAGKLEPKFGTTGGAVWLPAHIQPVDYFRREAPVIWPPTVMVWYTTASKAGQARWGDEAVEEFSSFTPTNIYVCQNDLPFNSWDDCDMEGHDCDVPYSRKSPIGWAGCSNDGVRFWNCYKDEKFIYDNPPFSYDDISWDVCTQNNRKISWDKKSKFVRGTPVFLSGADFDYICNDVDPDNLLCDFYSGEEDNGGVLIYGNGRPEGRSPLYLAYIEAEDLVEGKRWPMLLGDTPYGRPIVHYYAFVGRVPDWSDWEEEAIPIPRSYWDFRSSPCHDPVHMYEGVDEDRLYWIDVLYPGGGQPASEDEFEDKIDEAIDNYFDGGSDDEAIALFAFKYRRRYQNCTNIWNDSGGTVDFRFSPETCYPAEQDRNVMSFTPNSAVIIREPEDEPPRILILGGNNYAWAYLTSPWEVYPGGSIGDVGGYGTFIINGGDNYIRYVEEKPFGHVLIFWVTVSSWKGWNDTPYGVYTKKVRISWPPAE
jgi:hypothetical protein